MTEEQEQQEVARIQRAIMQVLRKYKVRGIEAVKEDVLRREVERRLNIKFED